MSKSFLFTIVLFVFSLSVPFCSLSAPYVVSRTGAMDTTVYGDDGSLRKGVVWPIPRFTDNNDGTILDNLTGLIWLKQADCSGAQGWHGALDFSNNHLEDGICGLEDNSQTGDWRLPNIREIRSLTHSEYSFEAIPDTAGNGRWSEGNPFTGIQPNYWSNTTDPSIPSRALRYSTGRGTIIVQDKAVVGIYFAWPVRGPIAGKPGPVMPTGQLTCYDVSNNQVNCAGTGQNGDHSLPLPWPTPRFVDNNDGTVTDSTGLTWLQNSACFEHQNWHDALTAIAALGNGICGLSDQSKPGDWRMPNTNEQLSLFSYEYNTPALTDTEGTGYWAENDPFVGIRTGSYYWSSTDANSDPSNAEMITFQNGTLTSTGKGNENLVLPVRGTISSFPWLMFMQKTHN